MVIKSMLYGLFLASIVQTLSYVTGLTDDIPSCGAIITFILGMPIYPSIELEYRRRQYEDKHEHQEQACLKDTKDRRTNSKFELRSERSSKNL